MSYGEYSVSVAVNSGHARFLHVFALKKYPPIPVNPASKISSILSVIFLVVFISKFFADQFPCSQIECHFFLFVSEGNSGGSLSITSVELRLDHSSKAVRSHLYLL